ncbi:MAG: V-ATPase V1 sector subunit E [Phylliscum demangeonii]|nr:MAG: V-ATPase V1 sector subunit E [Phylliscum demangeonii]
MSHALSDDEVARELRKMTAFIRQEAVEKAKEIEIKADEEYAIEKSKLVRQETAVIDRSYASRWKTAALSQQITRSKLANRTRLQIINAKQTLVDEIMERARHQLSQRTDGDHAHDAYRRVLRDLMLEGAYALREPTVAVKTRRKDVGLAKAAASEAQRIYKEQMHHDVTMVVDEDDPLPESCTGGVSIVGGGGKIDINNTLDERLHLLQTESLPAVRATLFGPNPNRKFYD